MSHVLLLDTNVWSHLLFGDQAKSAAVRAQLATLRLKYPGAAVATSGICIAECMVAARRVPGLAERTLIEAAYMLEFSKASLMVVEVTAPILDKAASLRAEALRRASAAGGTPASADGGKLKLPDAIIAATCMDFNPVAILVTENIGDFQYIENGIFKTVSGLTVEKVG